MEDGKATASYLSALCIYGTIGLVLSYINLPSEIAALCRGLIGFAFILGVLYSTKRHFDWTSTRANLKWLAVGGLCLGFNWVLLFAAYRATTVAIASLCNYMAPIILIIVTPLVLGEKRSVKKAVCGAIAVVGMVMVSGVLDSASSFSPTGVGLALAAAVMFAAMVLANKKLGDVPTFERSSTQLLFATVAALPFVLANNFGQPLTADALSIGLILLLGIVHSGVAYCLYFRGLEGLGAQTVAVLGYVEPAVSVLVSALIMHEPLSIMGWIGTALIIGAAAASEVVK